MSDIRYALLSGESGVDRGDVFCPFSMTHHRADNTVNLFSPVSFREYLSGDAGMKMPLRVHGIWLVRSSPWVMGICSVAIDDVLSSIRRRGYLSSFFPRFREDQILDDHSMLLKLFGFRKSPRKFCTRMTFDIETLPRFDQPTPINSIEKIRFLPDRFSSFDWCRTKLFSLIQTRAEQHGSLQTRVGFVCFIPLSLSRSPFFFLLRERAVVCLTQKIGLRVDMRSSSSEKKSGVFLSDFSSLRRGIYNISSMLRRRQDSLDWTLTLSVWYFSSLRFSIDQCWRVVKHRLTLLALVSCVRPLPIIRISVLLFAFRVKCFSVATQKLDK